MWRYLLSGFLVIAGIVALLGGVLEPLSRSALSIITPTPKATIIPTPNAAIQRGEAQLAEVQAEIARTTQEAEQARQQRDALTVQLAELQAEIARSRIEADQARQTLDNLREQARTTPVAPAAPSVKQKPPPRQMTLAEREAAFARRQELATAEPAGITPRQRLRDARVAVIEGRTADAVKLLQEAQTQLVFRPVSPSQDDLGPTSHAALRITRALSMLQAADLPRAIENIDIAMQESPQ